MIKVFKYLRDFFKCEIKRNHIHSCIWWQQQKGKKRCNKKKSGVIRETEKLNEKEFIKFKIGKYYDRYQNNRISN